MAECRVATVTHSSSTGFSRRPERTKLRCLTHEVDSTMRSWE